jgi:excisionase family DNA binding protein
MEMEKAMSPRQAALKLGINLHRLYMLIYSGKVPATKTDGRWLISETAVNERLQRLEARHAR